MVPGITIGHCILKMLFIPLKSVHLPCCYYQLCEIKKYKYEMASNDIILISNFLKIHQAVFILKQKDGQAWQQWKQNKVFCMSV